jgi:putative transcriptional regulator
MPKADITNQIRRLRFEHDEMTQQELADRVGCTRQTILLLERGRYVPSLALAFRIARTFDTTVEAVFQFVEEP